MLVTLTSSLSSQDKRSIGLVAPHPITGDEVEMYRESWPILIGINRYSFVDMLDYAVADADSVRSLLIRQFEFNPKNIIFLKDERATKARITEAFGTLLQTHPNDRVLVFYAGHGTQIDLPGGGEMGFLIPADGKAGGSAELYSTCISMQEIRNLSSLIPAKHVLFLVDACYGGLAATTSRVLARETKQYLRKITVSKARQIITAGGRGEQVIEKPEWGHSAFTYKLIEGLEKGLADVTGDYLVTASELFTYLKPSVSAASDNRQTPVFKAFTEDEGDFVFVLAKPTYAIDVASFPSGALVMVDGERMGLTPLTLDLERGEYQLEIFKGGYQLYRQTLTVAGSATITAQLVEDVYELAITSNPSGGQVYINGVERGKTALVVKLKPGTYTILIEMEGYHPWTREIEVTSNQSVTASFVGLAELPPVVRKTEEKKPEETPRKPPMKEEQKLTKQKKSKTWLYVVGGLAVAGGAAAYFILSGEEEAGPGQPSLLTDEHPVLPP